jgi:hypothetical protein
MLGTGPELDDCAELYDIAYFKWKSAQECGIVAACSTAMLADRDKQSALEVPRQEWPRGLR